MTHILKNITMSVVDYGKHDKWFCFWCPAFVTTQQLHRFSSQRLTKILVALFEGEKKDIIHFIEQQYKQHDIWRHFKKKIKQHRSFCAVIVKHVLDPWVVKFICNFVPLGMVNTVHFFNYDFLKGRHFSTTTFFSYQLLMNIPPSIRSHINNDFVSR